MTSQRSASGEPIDCTQLDGSEPFGGAVLVAALPILALPQLGDAAVAVALHCLPVAAVATPTPRFVRTCVPTATPTSTPGSGETPSPAPTSTASPLPTVPPSPTDTVAVASPNATFTATHSAPPPTTAATVAETASPPPLTPTGGVPPACAGDCNGDGTVTIDELVRAVNIALGSTPIAQCAPIDSNADGAAGIEELIRAVNNTLQGCPL